MISLWRKTLLKRVFVTEFPRRNNDRGATLADGLRKTPPARPIPYAAARSRPALARVRQTAR